MTSERWVLRGVLATMLGAGAGLAQVAPPADAAVGFVTLDAGQLQVLEAFQAQYGKAFGGLAVRSDRTPRGGRPGQVSVAQLRRVAPQLPVGLARQTVPHLNKTMQEFQINTARRQAAFLAQVAHESGGFVHRTELASGARYEGRRSLGNTQPGDGRRFKGRGYIQLTGRANYRKASRALGRPFERQPTMVARIDNAAQVSGWFWNDRRLNAYADRGDFSAITRRINGGQNGRRSREQYHARAKRALSRS